ncbi:zona pellucida sperm-binding protein 3b [Pseudorasbora parva]|uniref:zona pellucida sperm-binding protein 3b n=1 Tax=Pseudorasbora parva TaxID=51549 RepID=UPI00351E06FD
MGLSSTLIWWITVFPMISLLTEGYPRTYPRAFQQGGRYLASQQLMKSQFQAAIPQSPPKMSDPVPQPRQKSVSVYCHDEAIEVVVNAGPFASGFPVSADELWLGQQSLLNKVSAGSCGAVQTGESQFAITASFKDCGTKLSVTDDSLVYSNVLVYAPLPSPDGVLRQDGTVVPVQCQFQRRYNVDSAAVAPAWDPFTSTIVATDYLDFTLRLMSDDWQHERGSNVYFLGDMIHLQASVTLANHLPLLLFVDWCIATPTFTFDASEIKYSFVEDHGCLSDSRGSYSHSKFLQRSDGNKLNLLLDAFRFHKLTSNLVYITCSMKAIPIAYSVSAQNRACSFIDRRWQSVDGNDEVCNSCEPSKQGAADPEPIKPFPITLAPAKQPNLSWKAGPATFSDIVPGQSLERFKTPIQPRQSSYGSLSKRGTDSSKDWKIATLGPLVFPMSSGHLEFSSPEVVSTSVTEEPEFFSLSEMGPVMEKVESKNPSATRSFHPIKDGLFLDVADLFGSEEASGFAYSPHPQTPLKMMRKWKPTT